MDLLSIYRRDYPVLKDDAVPTLFDNTQSYLSSLPPPKRKDPDERRATAMIRDHSSFEQWLDEDCISSIDTFKSMVHDKYSDLLSQWIIVHREHFVLFIVINDLTCPHIVCSFKVLTDMQVQMFQSEKQRDIAQLSWLLGVSNTLTRWSQLPNICAHLKNACESPILPLSSVDCHVATVADTMKELIDYYYYYNTIFNVA